MAALQNIQHVSEFSPDGKLFAFINSEGKLKIWDTESNELKQEYIPNLHLNAPCTCFTWITTTSRSDDTNSPSNGQKKAKKSRKSLDQIEQCLYIAFGTNKGGVVLYSYATGKIERHLKGDSHAGSVTAICLGPSNSDKLFTSGDDCRVIVWSLANSAAVVGESWKIGSDKPTCLVYLKKSNQLLIGARELKQWSVNCVENDVNDFNGPELQQTYTGHKSNVNIFKYFQVNNIEYVLSTSQMDRTISLWRIKSGQKYKNAVATLLMEDIAYSISCSVRNDDTNRVEVAAVTRSGGVHLFIIDDVSKVNLEKTIKPKVTIHIASDPMNNNKQVVPIPIITATLDLQFKKQAMLIGYGDRQILCFEQLELDTSKKNQMLIRNDPKDMFLVGLKQNATNRDKSLKTMVPIVDGSAEYQTATPQLLRKAKAIEMPMETRLENLSLAHATHSNKNVAQLLVQGLHNRDSNILKNVFTSTDEKLIRSTLQRLPPQYVSPLVNELTLLTQKKTSNVHVAVIWLKLLAQTHASQLMALGTNSLHAQFGPLIGVIEQRTNSIRQLSRLSGRLELLVSQIKRNNDDDEILYNENMLVIEDNDSSIESDVDIDGTNSSDDQWEEEEEEDEDDSEEGKSNDNDKDLDDDDDDDDKMEISDVDN